MTLPSRWRLRRSALALLAGILVAVGTASQTAVTTQPTAPVQASAARAERPSFSAEHAAAHLSILSQTVGSRPAGSGVDEQAVGYVADTWRSLGYQPDIQSFQFNVFQERDVSLTVSDSGDQIKGSAMRGGPPGEVQADIIDAGLGRAEDLGGTDLQGRIALIRRGDIRFSDKITNVSALGAVGVVIDNNQPGGFVGTLSGPATIPAIGISQEDGRALRQQLALGPLQARLSVDGGNVDMTASNVTAVKPGTGDGIVIIGAHIDSVPAGPGANDNGSGVAVVTELARSVLGRTYPFEIRFAAFGAEEIGLIGSSRYVAAMPDSDRQRVLAMINLDMVGVGSQLRFGGAPDLVGTAIAAAATVGEHGSRINGGLSSASDHASFTEAGMPGLFIYRSEDPNYHTANDRFENVEPRNLEIAGRTVIALLDMLAADADA